MSEKPLPTRPVSENENLLRKKFYENVSAQSDLMDKLSAQILTLELAIPGLFATVLKLVRGDKATLTPNPALSLAFACWFLALLLTFAAIFPRKWKVDASILRQSPEKLSESLGLQDFFEKTAAYKRVLVSVSGLLFFAGIIFAAFSIG